MTNYKLEGQLREWRKELKVGNAKDIANDILLDHYEAIKESVDMEMMKNIINCLLPTWQKGDIVIYDNKEYRFNCFTYTSAGNVNCSLTPMEPKTVNGAHDFFSGALVPFHSVRLKE